VQHVVKARINDAGICGGLFRPDRNRDSRPSPRLAPDSQTFPDPFPVGRGGGVVTSSPPRARRPLRA